VPSSGRPAVGSFAETEAGRRAALLGAMGTLPPTSLAGSCLELALSGERAERKPAQLRPGIFPGGVDHQPDADARRAEGTKGEADDRLRATRHGPSRLESMRSRMAGRRRPLERTQVADSLCRPHAG